MAFVAACMVASTPGFSSDVTLTAHWILPEKSRFTRSRQASISPSSLWLHSAIRLASSPRT